MRFLVSTENEILLLPIFGSFGKIFSLKMKTEIQPNTFSSPFYISSKNENRKQPNQTPLKFSIWICKKCDQIGLVIKFVRSFCQSVVMFKDQFDNKLYFLGLI